ncbi:uncharacterized protein LOC144141042 [Haemaphysalis longicornis]
MAAYEENPPAAWTMMILVEQCATNSEDNAALTEDSASRVAASPAVFVCPECGDCLSSQEYLNKHMLDAHTQLPKGKWQCPYCPYTSKKRGNLVQHERTHTGDRPFTCPLCNRGFRQKKNLVKHQRVHTGEKPYKCSLCGRQFRDEFSLSRHNKLHLDDDKPHACHFCGKTFRHKFNLTQHLLIHMAEKRHACRVCGQAFTLLWSAKQHERRVHGGQPPSVDCAFSIVSSVKVELKE